MLGNKKGLSVIIGAVLLIVIGVTMGAAIFLWSGDFISRLSPPVDCSEVGFEAEIYREANDYFLGIINTDDISLNGFVIKSVDKGEVKIESEIDLPVQPGETQSVRIDFVNANNEGSNFLIIPKISVKNADGEEVISVCSDNDGYETQYRSATVVPNFIEDTEIID